MQATNLNTETGCTYCNPYRLPEKSHLEHRTSFCSTQCERSYDEDKEQRIKDRKARGELRLIVTEDLPEENPYNMDQWEKWGIYVKHKSMKRFKRVGEFTDRNEAAVATLEYDSPNQLVEIRKIP